MVPGTVRAFIQAQPFRPFRIVMNSGKAFEVRHPEMIHLGKDFFNYYSFATAEEYPESWETVSLLLIESVEHLAGKGHGSGNGPPKV